MIHSESIQISPKRLLAKRSRGRSQFCKRLYCSWSQSGDSPPLLPAFLVIPLAHYCFPPSLLFIPRETALLPRDLPLPARLPWSATPHLRRPRQRGAGQLQPESAIAPSSLDAAEQLWCRSPRLIRPPRAHRERSCRSPLRLCILYRHRLRPVWVPFGAVVL
jgi:hypothetical protein